MRLISIDPPVLEIDYEELEAMTDPDAEMAAFLDDAVGAYLSWLEQE